MIDDCSPGLSEGREGGLKGCRRASNSVGCFPFVPYQVRMEIMRYEGRVLRQYYLVVFLSRSIS